MCAVCEQQQCAWSAASTDLVVLVVCGVCVCVCVALVL